MLLIQKTTYRSHMKPRQWDEISKQFPSRTIQACQRHSLLLSRGRSEPKSEGKSVHLPWTADEVQKLFTLPDELEGDDSTDNLWYKISKAVG